MAREEEKVEFMSEGMKLYGILHPTEEEQSICVVLSHGFLSSKDGDKYIALSEELGKKGFASFRFDFRGCGESEGSLIDTTLSNRLKDLDAAIDFICTKYRFKILGLLGSSFGGVVSILKAKKDERVKALVTLATLSNFDFMLNNELLPYKKVLPDAVNYDIVEAIGKIKNVLIIHGKSDTLVPFQHAITLHQHAKKPKSLELIDGGDHIFSSENLRKKVVNLAVDWFAKTLRLRRRR